MSKDKTSATLLSLKNYSFDVAACRLFYISFIHSHLFLNTIYSLQVYLQVISIGHT